MTPYRDPRDIQESIVGHIQNSCNDWPGKISTVIFLSGCNIFCPTCHNWEIAHPQGKLDKVLLDNILMYIQAKRKWLDGVVISGGEPLIHNNLSDLVFQLKSISDLPIKLDTNGLDPDALDEILATQYIDTVAMDIKAYWDKYPTVTGCKQKDPEYFQHHIERSIQVIQAYQDVHLYFRTTLVPEINDPIYLEQVKSIIPAGYVHRYQTYRPIDHTTTKGSQ